MKRIVLFISTILLILSTSILAGPPMINLEGVGGIAFNPLAYPVGQNKSENKNSIFSNPQFGMWYVNLDDVKVDWTTIGVAQTISSRFEYSFGYESISPNGRNLHKKNIGAKYLIVKENAGDNKYVPAISVGAIYKNVSKLAPGTDDNDIDYYLVATKFFTDFVKPTLISAGVLSTKGQVTGVFGFNKDRKTTFFSNIDVVAFKNTCLGFEFKQAAKFNNFKNDNYWNAHIAYFVNNNLTLIGAYVDAGDENSLSKVGLGTGTVVSFQYAF